MSKTFRAWRIDEPLFLPPMVGDFVAKDHLACFVLSLVRDDLGLGEITGTYGSERGQPPFDPILRLIEESGEFPCLLRIGRFGWGMIRGGFLSAEDRKHLIALARDGLAASRLTRRAKAFVLVGDGGGWSKGGAAFL